MTRKWLLIIILIPSRVGHAHALEKQVITSKFFCLLFCSSDLLFWFLPYRSTRQQGAENELMFVGDEWSDRRSLDQVRVLSSFFLFSRALLYFSFASFHAKDNVPYNFWAQSLAHPRSWRISSFLSAHQAQLPAKLAVEEDALLRA
jgi:hypothetical protein